MTMTIKRLYYSSILLTVFLSIGCTHVYNVPDLSLKNQEAVNSVNDKIELVVNLCLTAELKETKWQKQISGYTYIIPIGNQLAKNASELSEIIFKEVTIIDSPASYEENNFDALLTPKVVDIERSLGAHAFAESVFIVVLEWKLEDANKNIIWIDSVRGEGRANTGNIFTHKINAEEQAEILLKDLFSKSFEAILASPEIRQFVANN